MFRGQALEKFIKDATYSAANKLINELLYTVEVSEKGAERFDDITTRYTNFKGDQ